MIIWGLIIWMIYEATMRLLTPHEVDGKIMLGTAIFGFIINLCMMKVIHS